MNKVKYIKVDQVDLMNSLIANLDIIQIIEDRSQAENIYGGTIKGFFVFFKEGKEAEQKKEPVKKITQVSFDMVHEKEHEPLKMQAQPVQSPVRTESLPEQKAEPERNIQNSDYISSYDELTKREREIEREQWNARMKRIKDLASEKND